MLENGGGFPICRLKINKLVKFFQLKNFKIFLKTRKQICLTYWNLM